MLGRQRGADRSDHVAVDVVDYDLGEVQVLREALRDPDGGRGGATHVASVASATSDREEREHRD